MQNVQVAGLAEEPQKRVCKVKQLNKSKIILEMGEVLHRLSV